MCSGCSGDYCGDDFFSEGEGDAASQDVSAWGRDIPAAAAEPTGAQRQWREHATRRRGPSGRREASAGWAEEFDVWVSPVAIIEVRVISPCGHNGSGGAHAVAGPDQPMRQVKHSLGLIAKHYRTQEPCTFLAGPRGKSLRNQLKVRALEVLHRIASRVGGRRR